MKCKFYEVIFYLAYNNGKIINLFKYWYTSIKQNYNYKNKYFIFV